MVEKIHYKNVEIKMTEQHHKMLEDHISQPQNEWLKAGLEKVVETDSDGMITMFAPMHTMSMGLVFFIQHLMITQRLDLVDEFLRKQGVM